MHIKEGAPRAVPRLCVWILAFGTLITVASSCKVPDRPVRRTERQSKLDPGWPQPQEPWHQTTVLPAGWTHGKQLWHPAAYGDLRVPLPTIEGAKFVGVDKFCATCHETYVKAFASNVHGKQGCEKCHGPGSIHIETRGSQPGTIISLKPSGKATPAGRPTTASERSEICLQCHDENTHGPGTTWRTSAHAHNQVACTDCHRGHYNVPPGMPATKVGAIGPPSNVTPTAWSGFHAAQQPATSSSRFLGAVAPAVCYQCHADFQKFEHSSHPHRIGDQFNCTTCHDPHGNIKAETRRDLCLRCHDGPHMNEWHGSPHDVGGVGCTDCHNPHPKVGPPMVVDQPRRCYRCHSEKRQLEQVAHPHQLLGPNGFNCTTCHRPHGRITAVTRQEACLRCHNGAPTMAWHSSSHYREGVACTDCHNPHPDTRVPTVVQVSHTQVKRSGRMPMCVDEPETCYKCHQKIFGLAAMPSHHPIREGKMVCSSCHDGHGQGLGNLKTDSLNELCYECHAEKEGPFVWEHPPVTEDCAICHEPHGTVANNLLRQPTTFLCLRCHTGHSTHDASYQCMRCHFAHGHTYHVAGGPRDPTIPTTAASRPALFTDCTQCHTQIHGSDFASGFECGHGMRR